ncbi:MAG: hypothetical protein Q7J68_04485 [Thermoplasmata archaeon]|nr:hypothetical protein [Thermoplasmata archaeon]
MAGFIFDGRLDEEEDEFTNRECYVFNEPLGYDNDDARCIHCKYYLTLQCKHISDFVDEEGDA